MKILPIIILTLCPLFAFATGQQMDILKYDGSDYKISIFPLEESPIQQIFSISAPTNVLSSTQTNIFVGKGRRICTGNYRGYVATWEIKDKKLYLVGISGWIANPHTKFVKCPTPENPNLCRTDTTYTYKKATLDLLFPDEVQDGRVHATWFSGKLFTGGWHPGIKRSPEMLSKQKQQAKLVFQIEEGVIKSIIDNRTPNQRLHFTVNVTQNLGNRYAHRK